MMMMLISPAVRYNNIAQQWVVLLYRTAGPLHLAKKVQFAAK